MMSWKMSSLQMLLEFGVVGWLRKIWCCQVLYVRGGIFFFVVAVTAISFEKVLDNLTRIWRRRGGIGYAGVRGVWCRSRILEEFMGQWCWYVWFIEGLVGVVGVQEKLDEVVEVGVSLSLVEQGREGCGKLEGLVGFLAEGVNTISVVGSLIRGVHRG
jgi:hypothetical protein